MSSINMFASPQGNSTLGPLKGGYIFPQESGAICAARSTPVVSVASTTSTSIAQAFNNIMKQVVTDQGPAVASDTIKVNTQGVNICASIASDMCDLEESSGRMQELANSVKDVISTAFSSIGSRINTFKDSVVRSGSSLKDQAGFYGSNLVDQVKSISDAVTGYFSAKEEGTCPVSDSPARISLAATPIRVETPRGVNDSVVRSGSSLKDQAGFYSNLVDRVKSIPGAVTEYFSAKEEGVCPVSDSPATDSLATRSINAEAPRAVVAVEGFDYTKVLYVAGAVLGTAAVARGLYALGKHLYDRYQVGGHIQLMQRYNLQVDTKNLQVQFSEGKMVYFCKTDRTNMPLEMMVSDLPASRVQELRGEHGGLNAIIVTCSNGINLHIS